MHEKHVAIAEAYYTAVGKKDVASIEKYVHPDIQFIAPLATVVGKEAFLEAAKNFAAFIKTLKIRASSGSGNHAMLVYDLDCPVGCFSTAALMTFQEGLIAKLELFYDARPFEKK